MLFCLLNTYLLWLGLPRDCFVIMLQMLRKKVEFSNSLPVRTQETHSPKRAVKCLLHSELKEKAQKDIKIKHVSITQTKLEHENPPLEIGRKFALLHFATQMNCSVVSQVNKVARGAVEENTCINAQCNLF